MIFVYVSSDQKERVPLEAVLSGVVLSVEVEPLKLKIPGVWCDKDMVVSVVKYRGVTIRPFKSVSTRQCHVRIYQLSCWSFCAESTAVFQVPRL